MKQSFSVKLNNLHFYAFIGVLEHEQTIGNNFIVNVCINFDASGFEMENLDSSICYAQVFDLIKKEMGKKWRLLESAATSISDLLKSEWPKIQYSKVEIAKMSVPIHNLDGSCSIELIRDYSI